MARTGRPKKSCATCVTPRKFSRQYLTNDADKALAAFGQRRVETLETFGKLTPAQWEKGCLHPVAGRITLDGFLSIMAWHDDNHLDQLIRALQGRA